MKLSSVGKYDELCVLKGSFRLFRPQLPIWLWEVQKMFIKLFSDTVHGDGFGRMIRYNVPYVLNKFQTCSTKIFCLHVRASVAHGHICYIVCIFAIFTAALIEPWIILFINICCLLKSVIDLKEVQTINTANISLPL